MQMPTRIDSKQLRTFGFLVGGVFATIGLWPILLQRGYVRLWSILLAALLVTPALVWPQSLRPVYTLWMRLADILGWVNTRILLSLIFYVLLTPMGVVRRVLLGKDSLQRTLYPDAETYRMTRKPRSRDHLKQQF